MNARTLTCVLLGLVACSEDDRSAAIASNDASVAGRAADGGRSGRSASVAGAAGPNPSEPPAEAGHGGTVADPSAGEGGAPSVRDTEPEDDAGAGASSPDACAAALGTDSGLRTLEVSGIERSYVLHVPERAGSSGPRPLVIDLHGLLMHGRYQRATSGFAGEADRHGFVVAYPDARVAWNAGSCCTPEPSVDDVGFIRGLIETLVKSGCIDAKRVYAAGVSAGGGLAQRLACEAADVIAAVTTREWDLLESDVEGCRPSRPIAVLSRRGQNDRAVPYGGGALRPANGLNETIRPLGAIASSARWAALAGCDDAPATNDRDCRVYAGCEAGVEVALCAPLPEPSDDAAAAWTFLERFALP